MACATRSSICRNVSAAAVVVGMLIASVETTLAAPSGQVGMWSDAGCWPEPNKVQYFSTPEAACKSQQMRCDPDFLFIGAQPTDKWDKYNCEWIRVGWLGGGGPLPGSTTFECPSGYTKKALYRCVKDENQRERPQCQDPESGQANPATPNPINLLTGSKLLTATDYETEDGLFRVRRYYRSTPSTNASVAVQHPAGLSLGWRFEFMPELHLETTGSAQTGYTYTGKVTWHAADGSSYDFKDPDQDGYFESDALANGQPNGDWEVARISRAANGESEWRIIQADGTIWYLKTYNTDQRGTRHVDYPRHNVARPTARVTADGYRWDYAYRSFKQLEACKNHPQTLCGQNIQCVNWGGDCDRLPDHYKRCAAGTAAFVGTPCTTNAECGPTNGLCTDPCPGNSCFKFQDGELGSIEDSFGRRLEFEWVRRDPNRMEPPLGVPDFRRFLEISLAVARITLPNGQIIRYAYDSAVEYNFERNFYAEWLANSHPDFFDGPKVDYNFPPDRLKRVERWDAGGDGKIKVLDNNEVDPEADDFKLDSTEYEFKQFPFQQIPGGPTVLMDSHLITRIKDHRGVTGWHFDYDDEGRAVLSERVDSYDNQCPLGYCVSGSCSGGTNHGQSCTDDCPTGGCSAGFCVVGGTSNGKACDDCPFGDCVDGTCIMGGTPTSQTCGRRFDKYVVDYSIATNIRRVTGPLGRKTDYTFGGSVPGDTTRLTNVHGIEGVGPSACLEKDSDYGYNSHGYINEIKDPVGNRKTTYTRVGSTPQIQSVTSYEGDRRIESAKFEWFEPWRVSQGHVNGLKFYATYDPSGQLTEWRTRDRGGRAGRRATSTIFSSEGLLQHLDRALPGTGDALDFYYQDGSVGGVDWLKEDGSPRFSMGIARDERGEPTDIWDVNGLHTQIEYNEILRTVTVTQNPEPELAAMKAVTVYHYTAAGDLARILRPDGSAVEYRYNDARKLIKVVGGAGTSTPIAGGDSVTFALNDAGQPLTATVKTYVGATEVTEQVVNLEFNELMRVRQRTAASDGRKTEFKYDKFGDLDKRIEPGFTTNAADTRTFDYAFGSTHQVESITEPAPDGGTTSLVYRYGVLDKVTDDGGAATSYSATKAGELRKVSSPDSGSTGFELNEHGLVVAEENADGDTTISRDGLGRVTAIVPDDAPGEEVYLYYDHSEGGTEPNYGVGKLTSIVDESGSTTLKYDALGRPYVVERAFGSDAYKTKYEYDLVGRIRKITYPSLREVQFFRDGAGKIFKVESKLGASTQIVAQDITHQPFYPWARFSGLVSVPAIDSPQLSGLKSLRYGNGADLTLDYDNDGRLKKMEVRECPSGTCVNGTCSGGSRNGLSCDATFLQNISLAYYASGHVQSISDSVAATTPLPSRTQSFAYDSVGRLNHATGLSTTYGDIVYDYDTVGNRTVRTVAGPNGNWTESYDYEANSNRLIKVSGIGVANQSGDLEYSRSGSVESDTRPGRAYQATYNRAGRLESVTMGNDTRTYIYDAFGHRVNETRDNGGTVTERNFVYDLAGHLIAEYADDPSTGESRLVQEYIWLDNTPIAMVWPSNDYFYIHTDHLGGPQIVTNSQRNVRWAGYFDPFGVQVRIETPGPAGNPKPSISLRFPGQEWDAITKLSQNWHRDYDPSLGRYIESDPIGLAGGINRYAYAGSDPLRATDPMGLLVCYGGVASSAVVGVGGEAAAGGFYSFDTDVAGSFAAAGVGTGLNAGKEVFAGCLKGDEHSLEGEAYNVNISTPFFSLTGIWNADGFLGLTGGYSFFGLPWGCSVSKTWGYLGPSQ
jgi:RHS repeat-associated protein